MVRSHSNDPNKCLPNYTIEATEPEENGINPDSTIKHTQLKPALAQAHSLLSGRQGRSDTERCPDHSSPIWRCTCKLVLTRGKPRASTDYFAKCDSRWPVPHAAASPSIHVQSTWGKRACCSLHLLHLKLGPLQCKHLAQERFPLFLYMQNLAGSSSHQTVEGG